MSYVYNTGHWFARDKHFVISVSDKGTKSFQTLKPGQFVAILWPIFLPLFRLTVDGDEEGEAADEAEPQRPAVHFSTHQLSFDSKQLF